MLDILKRYNKTAITFIIFVVYTAGLLASYYSAQSKLEDDVLNEIRLETEKQAVAISYFFAERRNDLMDLAGSTEVGNFFTNRDLGMSYEYGLAINVQSVEAQFARLLVQKKLGGTPIYAEFVLIDSDDQVVAHTRHGNVRAIYEEGLHASDSHDAATFLSNDKQRLYITAPVWVKNLYRGQIIAWSEVQVLGGLMAETRSDRLGTRLVAATAIPALPEGITADFSAELHQALVDLRAQPNPLATSDMANGDIIAVVRANIGGSPFSLIAPITEKLASARSVPLFFLIAAAVVPMVVLVIALLDVFERRRTEEMREAARVEAERLARLRSEFLANMSHEIRTPLNGVLGLAQIGFRNNTGRPEVMDTFARILESGKLLLGIVNDVLDFSKIEAGKLSVEKAPVNLHGVIDEVVAMHVERASAKGLPLRVEKSPGLPKYCLSDPIRLAQILTNLLSNAVKFTECGNVVLSAEHLGGHLHLAVTDTGIGMAPEQIERLFAPFEQADSSTTRNYGGTGLGLAITKRLVGLMGGTINVRSQPGGGTTFDVLLPYLPVPADRTSSQPLPKPITSGPRLTGVRVLVAEDNDVNRMILEDMLTVEGATATMVENGQQAVERVSRDGPSAYDLVLMDIQMPIMDGFEATRQIRALVPELPIVAQTAHALSEELARCQAAGMVDQLTKPIDCERLVEMVQQRARRDAVPTAESRQTTAMMAPATQGETLIDWAALRSRYAHKPDFLHHLLTTAINSLQATPGNLRSAVLVGDMERTIFLAHSLKGVAGNLAANQLAKQASEAELACRSRAPGADRLAAALADDAERLSEEIRVQVDPASEIDTLTRLTSLAHGRDGNRITGT